MDKIIKDELRNRVWTEKYKASTDNSPDDTFKRVSQAIMGMDYLPAYEKMKELKFLPGGRIIAGAGVEGNLTLANCYVIPIKDDSIEAIFECAKEMACTYKQGGGVGTDISCLRPKDSLVNNAAKTSTGAVSFMEIFDRVTAVVGGKNRRGALMLSLHCSHPDIFDFIRIKDDDNKSAITNANISVKVTDAFMVAVEEDADWELWYPTLVDFESSKYEEVENLVNCYDIDSEYYKVNDKYYKRKVYKVVKAKEIWDEIIKRAWNSAEPGIIYWDTMIEDNSTEEVNKLHGVNPCISKNNMILTSLGWKKVEELIGVPFKAIVNGKEYKSEGFFHTGKKDVYKVILSNGAVIECTKDHKFYINDTDKVPVKDLVGKSVCGGVTVKSIEYLRQDDVYDCTVEIVHKYNCEGVLISNCAEQPLAAYGACCLGSINLARFVVNKFENPVFDFEDYVKTIRIAVEFLDCVIDKINHPLPEQNKHSEDWRRIGLGLTGLGHCLVYMKLKYDSDEAIEFVDKIAAVLEAEAYKSSFELAKTKGAYPRFSAECINGHLLKVVDREILDYDELLEHGIRNAGILTIAPSGSISILADCSSGIEPIFELEYMRNSDSLSQSQFKVYDRAWKEYIELKGNNKPSYFVTAYEVDPLKKIELQATLQKYIDTSISVTTNLKKDVKVEVVDALYKKAWEVGCKGLTIYREGSRTSVLTTATSSLLRESHEILNGRTIMIPTKDKIYITVNYHPITDKAMEVFISSAKSGSDKKAINEGYGRLISLFLQQGGDIEDVITTLLDIKGDNIEFAKGWTIQSLPDAIAKGILKCLGNLEIKVKCPECGGEVRMTGGCLDCAHCGYSKCG